MCVDFPAEEGGQSSERVSGWDAPPAYPKPRPLRFVPESDSSTLFTQ